MKINGLQGEALTVRGRQITFPDSIDFIVEAMDPDNGIFDETGEIPGVPQSLEARKKNSVSRYTNPGYIYQYHGLARPSSVTALKWQYWFQRMLRT